jgi:nitroreductase
MNTKFRDKPAAYPARGADGKPLKPLPQVLLDRRATAHFKPDSVPEEYLEAILRFGTQAPSGYNLQPWRFLVVREKENRQRLKTAAFGQQKIAEAPVVIIAYAIQNDWRNYFDDILEEGVRRGCTSRDTLPELKQQAANFLEKQISQSVWLNRQTMIAVTSMMLLAGAFGLDTAPMEGFDPLAIGRAFGLPENAEVIALLAVGFARDPKRPAGHGSGTATTTLTIRRVGCSTKSGAKPMNHTCLLRWSKRGASRLLKRLARLHHPSAGVGFRPASAPHNLHDGSPLIPPAFMQFASPGRGVHAANVWHGFG